MSRTRILGLAGAGLIAGALVLGGAGFVAAQTPPNPGVAGPGGRGPALMQEHGGRGPMAGRHVAQQGTERHAQVQAAVAEALGLTAEQLQAELAAGKTVPQIAQERGVDLAKVHEAARAAHPSGGQHGQGQGHRGAAGGPGASCHE